MTYTPTYTDTDLGTVVVDVIAKIFVAIGILAVLIGLVIVYRFLTGQKLVRDG